MLEHKSKFLLKGIFRKTKTYKGCYGFEKLDVATKLHLIFFFFFNNNYLPENILGSIKNYCIIFGSLYNEKGHS